MAYDNEALERKKQELQVLVRSAIPSSGQNSDCLEEEVMRSFIRLTPPVEPPMVFEMITMRSSGSGEGQSRKPGNIYLNMEKLMDVIPDVTLAAVGGATSPPWVLPFIGLYVWNKLWCSSKEELSETEATIIYVLWKHRNAKDKIAEDDAFEKTNGARNTAGIPLLKRGEFDQAVNRLVRMECIEIENGIIWLREWVCIKY